ncbi:MAG: hypothetical protein SGILL_004954 [Bacillariaceae sp.]
MFRISVCTLSVSLWLAMLFPFCHGFSAPSSTSSTTSNGLETTTTTNGSDGDDQTWKPKISSLEKRRNLRGMKHNSENVGSIGFHHVEFYCGDARSAASQFAVALGMSITGTTGQATGNDKCVSYALESGDQFRLLLTAPYSRAVVKEGAAATAAKGDSSADADDNTAVEFDAPSPLPKFDVDQAHEFFQKHGLAARAVGIEVVDATKAFEASVANGAAPVLEPTFVPTCPGQETMFGMESTGSGCHMAEVSLYGDVVLRYISYADKAQDSTRDSRLPFLPHLAPFVGGMANRESFGIYRIDHAVGNVPNLQDAYSRIQKFTGFHEFAEFTTEDVGTVESGLNSVVLASDSEEVLLPLNEPTNGRRKSQIQTYLEQNEGAGLQHLALKTSDIFSTVRKMREVQQDLFGFELMKQPSDEYYRELPDRLGDRLTPEQYVELEELGILADADDEGVLLQLFTKPVGDRPTFFFEIIQRVGCVIKEEKDAETILERPGCGGFGQGNFRELFKSIEEHERTLKV